MYGTDIRFLKNLSLTAWPWCDNKLTNKSLATGIEASKVDILKVEATMMSSSSQALVLSSADNLIDQVPQIS